MCWTIYYTIMPQHSRWFSDFFIPFIIDIFCNLMLASQTYVHVRFPWILEMALTVLANWFIGRNDIYLIYIYICVHFNQTLSVVVYHQFQMKYFLTYKVFLYVHLYQIVNCCALEFTCIITFVCLVWFFLFSFYLQHVHDIFL